MTEWMRLALMALVALAVAAVYALGIAYAANMI